MATHARQQYFADESSLSKERREFSIADEIQEKIDSVEEGAQVNRIDTIKVNGTALVPDIAKAVNVEVPDVIDNLYTVDSNNALSAKQGKILYDYIQNLLTIGRFLSNWDSATGLPITNPSESPYIYKAGDYYRVSNVATSPATNYKPDGSSFIIGQASTTIETSSVSVSDLYLYDGTTWILLSNSGSGIAVDSSLSTTSTNPVENRVITNALNGKQEILIAGNNIQIAADGKTISATDTTYTAGANISIDANNQISATDTTYTAGTGISIDANNVISNTQTSAEWGNIEGNIEDQLDLQKALEKKQDKLTAGTDLEIIEGGEITEEISGYGSIILTEAVEDGLNSVTLTGGCEQTATPTPSTPVDITTNNGDITVSPNLFRTLGTTTTQGGVTFAVQPDGSVRCTGQATGYYSWYMGRADVTPDMGTVTLRIDGVYNADYNIVVDKVHVYSGSSQIATLNWTNRTTSLAIDLSQYPTATSIRVWLKRNSNKATDATIKARLVKGTTQTAWKPYGEITTDGTVETVTDEEGNTATAEMLLAMNTYADTQELLSGVVNRQLAILVLTGTEAWGGSASNNYFSLEKTDISPAPISTGVHCYCTHFVSDSSDYTNTAGKFWLGGSYLNINYNNQGGTSASDNMTAFKNWLKVQYANGTPVIVIYPLATETTETVTGQTLTTIEGDNTIEITQASINNLPIEANYTAVGGDIINFTNETGYITSADLSGYQTVSNMVTSLSGADNDHYPTAKAVSDAIEGIESSALVTTQPTTPTEGAVYYDTVNDVVKVYDGSNWNIVGDDSADINTKTFYLSSSSDLVNAQAGLDWYLAGKNPIFVLSNNGRALTVYDVTSTKMRIIGNIFSSTAAESYTNLGLNGYSYTISNGTIVSSESTTVGNHPVLDPTHIYSTPYTPQYDGSPATKKYVDDSITGLGLGTAATKDTGTSSGNVPVLDSNGHLASSTLPGVALTDTFTVSTSSDLTTLSSADQGDIAIVSGENKTYVLSVAPYSTASNWKQILSPTGGVTSVNGQTGAVTLSIPTDTSDLTNGAGYLTSSTGVTTFNGNSGAITYTAPVTSVNNQTGAVSLAIPSVSSITVTLTAANWSNNEITVTATGVTASNTVIVAPDPSSMADYTDGGVYCSAQASNSLTFVCDTEPSNDIDVNVVILG